MNTRTLLAASTLALLSSFGVAAHAAGEGDNLSPYAQQVTSQRSRADVQAEAVQAARTQNNSEVADDGVQRAPASATSRVAVRTQAIQAARADQIARGEFTRF